MIELLKGSGFHLGWWKRPGVRLWWRLHNLVSILNWTSKGKNVIVCKLYLNKVIERKRERERERKKERDGRKEGNNSYLHFPWSNRIPPPSPSLPVFVVHSKSVCLVPKKHLSEAWDSLSIDTWPPPPPRGTPLTYTALLLGLEKGRSRLHRHGIPPYTASWRVAFVQCTNSTSVRGSLASCLAPSFSTQSLFPLPTGAMNSISCERFKELWPSTFCPKASKDSSLVTTGLELGE